MKTNEPLSLIWCQGTDEDGPLGISYYLGSYPEEEIPGAIQDAWIEARLLGRDRDPEGCILVQDPEGYAVGISRGSRLESLAALPS